MQRFPFLALLALALVAPSVVSRAAEVAATKSRVVLTAATERADAIYRKGETITFVLRVTVDDRPAESGEVVWSLTKDGLPLSGGGRAAVQRGQATVTGVLDEPGFVQCKASYQAGNDKANAVAGAGVAPLEIKPSLAAPADFDAFWAEQKKSLAAVPMNPHVTTMKAPSAGLEAADVQLDSVGAPVSGYYVQPAGAAPKSLPAVLTVHGAGVKGSSLGTAAGWARDGAIAMDINAHGLPNGQHADYYEKLATGELKDYRVRGRESRDTVYFRGMILRLIRAIDFLTSRPEWDGRTVVVFGSSQGGLQAIAAAGLDRRVSFFVAGVPAGNDHTGSLVNRIAGWPKFIPTGEKPSAAVLAAVPYYDGVNFAARAKAPGFFTVGFIDTTCPPSSVYAAYNALTTPKEIFNDIPSGHTNSPAARDAMRAAVLAHFGAQRAAVK
jgi:cephalosporin-C deacetylase-like acetyl esterase